MKDISSKKDIEFLMRSFYNKALIDPSIRIFFIEIAKIDLEKHVPHIVSFWEQQLFRKGDYKKNVLQIHNDLSTKKTLQKIHF